MGMGPLVTTYGGLLDRWRVEPRGHGATPRRTGAICPRHEFGGGGVGIRGQQPPHHQGVPPLEARMQIHCIILHDIESLAYVDPTDQ